MGAEGFQGARVFDPFKPIGIGIDEKNGAPNHQQATRSVERRSFIDKESDFRGVWESCSYSEPLSGFREGAGGAFGTKAASRKIFPKLVFGRVREGLLTQKPPPANFPPKMIFGESARGGFWHKSRPLAKPYPSVP